MSTVFQANSPPTSALSFFGITLGYRRLGGLSEQVNGQYVLLASSTAK